MNILFLCHRIPFPPDKGEKIRALHMLKHLAARHTVYLGTFVDDPDDMQHIGAVDRMVGGRSLIVPLGGLAGVARMFGALFKRTALTTAFFRNAKMRRWVAQTLRTAPIDRVVIFSTAMTPYLLDLRDFPFNHVIFDMVDIDSDKWRQYAKTSFGPRSWIYRREARLFFALERQAADAFGATLLVSPFETQTFADMAPEARSRLHTVSNGVDLNYFEPNAQYANPFAAAEIPIVMTGRMDYRPNVDAALWFAQKVLPKIRAALPAARFYAVGAQPSAKLKAIQGDAVTVTGTVDDVRPYLAHAAAVVAPLRIARGTQNKVLEAMAMQKPVIATSAATRALDVRAGADLWIADEPDRFAASVIDAINGPDGARIAAAGRAHIETHYDWARTLARLDTLLEGRRNDMSQPQRSDRTTSWTPRTASAMDAR